MTATKILLNLSTIMYLLQDRVWGVAYEIPPEQDSSITNSLNVREQRYDNRKRVAMYSPNGEVMPNTVLVYVGASDPSLYLGEAPMDDMARQIALSHGPSGANSEYLFQLAMFMRTEVPQAQDDHLFRLEAAVNEFLKSTRKEQLVKDPQ